MKRLFLFLSLLLLLVNPAHAATATLLPNGEQQFIDANGVPYAGGHVYFYVPNTSTPKNTWQDAVEGVLNTNPVTLDSAGRAIIYGDGQYRQVVFDSLGNLVWDQITSSVAQTNQAVTSTGSPNAYVVAYPSAPSALIVGAYYPFIANFQNTNTTPTENVNGIGAKTITKNGTMALASGDICVGQVVVTVWDGTEMQMTNPPCNGVSVAAVTSIAPDANNNLTFTPNPITSTGTIGLASIANNRLLGNASGGSAAPSAITASQALAMVTTTQGKIIEMGAASTAQGIGPGTAGQVLTSNGAAADPSFQTPSSAMTLLSTVNASAASSVVFGNTFITSTYNKYVVEFDSMTTSNAAVNLYLQVSSNNGGTWLGNYQWAAHWSGAAGAGADAGNTADTNIDLLAGLGISNAANKYGSGTIKFSKPSASNMTVFVYDIGAWWNTGPALLRVSGSGLYPTAGTINAIQILPSAGTITGNFHLYGITGS